MNCIIESRSDMTYQTAITTNAARKRNPDTPVINVGSISLCLVATQRKIRAEAMSITKTKHALTIMAHDKSSDHASIATNPQMVSTQQSKMLCTMKFLLALSIFITLCIYSSLISIQRLTMFFCTSTKPPQILMDLFSLPDSV